MPEEFKKGSTILKRFGRYLLLDHLVDGGMAKICRARYLGEQADKIVAIKMIQPQYSQDQAFVKMFEDEIKVTFGLIHPNIAQTYTTGKIEDQLFVAMEYVDGKNLKQFQERLKQRNFKFPVGISVYISSQVCQALSYAHNYTDKLSGKKLNIIHRDISPHNIMITYDGAVKVIDFGIAKAETNSDATQAGTIKGKLSYLAPEYLESGNLDHRYDQFAVGITLWELLCSRKLFKAPNDLAVLKLIQACKVPPPSSINSQVPPELDQIVMRSLSKDPQLRYENMEKFNRDLVKFLYSNYPDFNPSDLSYFSQELFKEEIKEDREKLKKFGKLDLTPFLHEMSDHTDSSFLNKKRGKTVKVKSKSKSEEGEESSSKDQYKNIDESRSSEIQAIEEIHEAQKIKLEPTQINRKTLPQGTGFYTADTGMHQVSRVTRIDRTRTKTTKKKKNKTLAAMVVALLLLAAGHWVYDKGLQLDYSKNSERTTASIPPSQEIKSQETKIFLTNTRVGQKIYINGARVLNYRAVEGITVPIGKTLKMRVDEEGRKSYIKEIAPLDASQNLSLKIPNMPEVETGEIYSGLNYSSGSVLEIQVGEHTLSYELPLKESIPLEVGEYPALIKNKVFGTKKNIEILVRANKRTKIPE